MVLERLLLRKSLPRLLVPGELARREEWPEVSILVRETGTGNPLHISGEDPQWFGQLTVHGTLPSIQLILHPSHVRLP